MHDVAIPDAGESLDVPHFRRADVDRAVFRDGHGLAVATDEVLLNADEMPMASRDLEDDFGVAHGVAVLLAIVGHGHQFVATRAMADVFNDQPV
jgi:hypothetical protein